MIAYYVKKDRELVQLKEPAVGCWVNISPPFSHEELEEVANQFDFPLDFLTDSLDIDERSRYEREDDVRLIVVNTPIINKNIEEGTEAIYITVPIGIILTMDSIITITPQSNPVLDLFLQMKVKNFDPDNEKLFVLQIFEQNVYRFLNSLKNLNHERNLIEKELSDSSRNKELKQLLRIEKALVYFVNTLSTNELLKMKMKRSDFLRIRDDEELTDLFEDIIIDNSQALEMSNIYTNILSGTMEAYASIISNNLNVVIQRLTTVTIILMVPTLVASFYGMNVPLPGEGASSSVYIIIIISIIASLMLAWWFRSRKLF